jgi:cytochrome P450
MSANGRIPPGPRGRPLVGNLPEFGKDVIGFFERCARDYGDIVSLRLGRWPAVFLNHPDYFEAVLLANNKNFIKHTFFWRHVTEIFGRGLVTNEGAPWLRQRRLMQPAFHREKIAGYGRTMVEHTERMLAEWDAAARGERDLHDAMMGLTMGIATRTLFGTDVAPDETAAIGAAFDDAVVEIARRFRRPVKIPDWLPLPSNRRYAAAVRTLDRLVYDTVAAKKRDGGGDDLLTMLMDARDEDGSAMDLRQIRDEAVTIFLAGHETTAIALSWTFHLVARHPAVEAKLLDEIRGVLRERPATAADVPLLPYAGHVVNESMRLFPPAYAFGREAVGPCEIGGYAIPAGTTIFISPWVAHRDPRWFDDPLAFRPERWENDLAKRLPRFAFLPFGGGPRVCIGNAFAMMEAVLILVSVLRRYGVRSVPGREPRPFASITLRPDGGMPMLVERRQTPDRRPQAPDPRPQTSV